MPSASKYLYREIIASYCIVGGLLLIASTAIPLNSLWGLTWPLFLILPGGISLLHQLARGKASQEWQQVVIGRWLISVSILFFFLIFAGFDAQGYWQSGILLITGANALLAYRNVGQRFWLFIGVVCFGLGAMQLLLLMGLNHYVWPIALIAFGAWLIRPKRL